MKLTEAIVAWHIKHVVRNTAIVMIGLPIGMITGIRWIKILFNIPVWVVFASFVIEVGLAIMGRGICKPPPERNEDCTGGAAT